MFNFIDEASERFLESFFLMTIEGFDREDMEEAINNDVSLLDECVKHMGHSLSMAEATAQRFRKYAHLLNTDNVLKWLKDRRYELWFGLASDPKAQAWLDRQVREFREYLFN